MIQFPFPLEVGQEVSVDIGDLQWKDGIITYIHDGGDVFVYVNGAEWQFSREEIGIKLLPMWKLDGEEMDNVVEDNYDNYEVPSTKTYSLEIEKEAE